MLKRQQGSLEPCAGKLARTVLRGLRHGNVPELPDQKLPDQRRKQPYFLHAQDEGPLAFAGLYEIWKNPELAEGDPHRWLVSTTVITHQATDAIGHVHDRMPLIIPPERLGDWLDPHTQEPDEVRGLLDAMPEPNLVPRKVSTLVNNVRNNGPELLAPVES